MYENSGSTIKSIGTVVFFVGLIISIWVGIMTFSVSQGFGAIIILLGAFLSYLAGLSLAGYGELIESCYKTNQKMEEVVRVLAALTGDEKILKGTESDEEESRVKVDIEKLDIKNKKGELTEFLNKLDGCEKIDDIEKLWRSNGLVDLPYSDMILTYLHDVEIVNKYGVVSKKIMQTVCDWIRQTINDYYQAKPDTKENEGDVEGSFSVEQNSSKPKPDVTAPVSRRRRS